MSEKWCRNKNTKRKKEERPKVQLQLAADFDLLFNLDSLSYEIKRTSWYNSIRHDWQTDWL